MNEKPFISIATPCRNSVRTIEKTIKSILCQEFKNYEYIIVDGGSTDGTLEIIKKYEPLFEGRLKWSSKPDKGIYDAFNIGVERSQGIYCWNVNSDDYISPNALKEIYNFVHDKKEEEYPIIVGNMNLIDASGKIISTVKQNKRKIDQGYKKDYIGISHPATIVPRSIYERIGTFDPNYKIIGDLDWFHRAYKAREKFAILDTVLSNMSDSGTTYQFNFKKSLQDRMYFLKKFYNNPIERLYRLLFWVKNFYAIKYSYKKKKNRL